MGMMSSPHWWSSCAGIALSLISISTYGFVSEPVAWQILTLFSDGRVLVATGVSVALSGVSVGTSEVLVASGVLVALSGVWVGSLPPHGPWLRLNWPRQLV
jgi:sulfite exporter TauE/SafE